MRKNDNFLRSKQKSIYELMRSYDNDKNFDIFTKKNHVFELKVENTFFEIHNINFD